MRLVTWLPDLGVAMLTFSLYAGIGLALPLVFDWSKVWLIYANLIGAACGWIVTIFWLVSRLKARDRRHLIDWTTSLRLLTAEEFEWLVGEMFRREGWTVRETGRQDGPDGNIDLELTRKGKRAIVQCKRWTARQIGVDEVRNFAGALLREGLSGNEGIFVTLSGFNEQARAEARKSKIEIIDNRDLHERIEKVRRNEPCNICGAPMMLDRSPRGWWFRCVATGCQGKRDLSNDPGRAVDLLTQAP